MPFSARALAMLISNIDLYLVFLIILAGEMMSLPDLAFLRDTVLLLVYAFLGSLVIRLRALSVDIQ